MASFSVRIKKLHFVNMSSVFERIFTLIRPLMKKEIIDVLHFHRGGLESLYEHVPKGLLPSEYEGDLGPIKNIHKDFMKLVEAKRFLGNKILRDT